MWFLLVPFVPKEPCSRPGDPDIAPRSNVPRCLLSPTSNEMPNSQLCPDITGSFSPNYNGDSGGFHFSSGAIYSGCFNRGKKVDFSCGWGHYGDDYALDFAAHYSNNVYGNSSSVSVPAAYALIIIRT